MALQRYSEVQQLDSQGNPAIDPSTGQVAAPMLEIIAPRAEKTRRDEELAICSVCGFAYPLSKLIRKSGKYYCTKFGCVNDTLSNPNAGFPILKGGNS